jgi:hypothetical protein
MSTLKQAAQQALDWIATKPEDRTISAGRMVGILTLALEAEQQDEPVGWMWRRTYKTGGQHWEFCLSKFAAEDLAADSASLENKDEVLPIYTHPQAAQQPLSDEQILRHITCSPLERAMFLRFARAIERAHGITGETK